MRNINLFVPKFRKDEIFKHMGECLDKGWTGLGFKTVEIEEEWKKYTGFETPQNLKDFSRSSLYMFSLRGKYSFSSLSSAKSIFDIIIIVFLGSSTSRNETLFKIILSLFDISSKVSNLVITNFFFAPSFSSILNSIHS
jgi:hypothetical protein